MDGTVDPGNPPAFTYQSNPYFTGLLGESSCADGTSTALCYARIYIPWDAVNDGKGSVSARTCQKSAAGPGTMAAVFAGEVSAAARAVGVGHVLVALATSLNTSTDDIWPTDSEYECGLSGLEQAAPGVTQWEIFNEPDSAYVPDSAPGGGPNCTQRNGIWVAAQNQCVFGSTAGTPPGGNGHGGSAQGAAYWYLDAKQVDPSKSHTLVAGGFNFNTSSCLASACYYLNGYFRELSAVYPTATRRGRVAPLPRRRLRGAQRWRSAPAGDFRPAERAGRNRRRRPDISHRSAGLGDRGRGMADELGERGGYERLR